MNAKKLRRNPRKVMKRTETIKKNIMIHFWIIQTKKLSSLWWRKRKITFPMAKEKFFPSFASLVEKRDEEKLSRNTLFFAILQFLATCVERSLCRKMIWKVTNKYITVECLKVNRNTRRSWNPWWQKAKTWFQTAKSKKYMLILAKYVEKKGI